MVKYNSKIIQLEVVGFYQSIIMSNKNKKLNNKNNKKNNNKIEQEQINVGKQILTFPNKLNTITILLIIILYLFILVFLTEVLPPKNDYIIKPDYEHIFYYNDVNSYVKVIGNIRKETLNEGKDNEKEILVPKYSIVTYASPNLNENIKGYEFNFGAIYGDDNLNYFPSIKQPGKIHSYQMLSLQKVSGNNVKSIFGNLNYYKNDDKYTYEFREDLFQLSSKDSKSKKYNNVLSNDYFEFNLDFRENTVNNDRYSGTIGFEVKDPTKKYHMDMQTWIINEDGEIFQFLGIYNFHTKSGEFKSNTNETIYKYVKPKQIYLEAVFYNENEEPIELYYKTDFTNLLN